MSFDDDVAQDELYNLREQFMQKDLTVEERKRIDDQMRVCKNPWNTVISAVNCDKARFKKIKEHVGRAIENMSKKEPKCQEKSKQGKKLRKSKVKHHSHGNSPKCSHVRRKQVLDIRDGNNASNLSK